MQSNVEFLCSNVRTQFYNRAVVEGRKAGKDYGITLKVRVEDKIIWMTFSKGEESHSITIPIPYEDNGVTLISTNDVKRTVCNYFLENEERELDYFSIMYFIICGECEGIISSDLVKKIPFIQQVVYSFQSGNASTVIYNLQRAINEVINKFPIHETYMNSWVMNRRLVIMDTTFDMLTDPKHRLDYQIEKNKKYFSKNGWTSIGLSDGVLANKNYILKYDIRKLTPFGMRHDNPGRNLYSTLGTRGDELPRVRSRSMQDLMDKGITREGWNLFTVFADIPDVFEDQIMVDKSHTAKFINYRKRIQCFGRLLVKEGDVLKYKQLLCEEINGETKLFDTLADHAVVERITESTANVGGAELKVFNVIVQYQRNFKDGVKITNLHGNKGVIRLKDLGYAIDPKTGEKRKIDIIVSAKSIKKRKNYGQLIEAILNVVSEDKCVSIVDDYEESSTEKMERALELAGYPKDGAWECHTYAGTFKTVCGTVFWGVTKDVEDQIWDKNDTIRRNGRELRTAGLKFSTVEFRGLITRFGKDNPVIDEIMSYAQGTEDLHEEINVLKSKRGELPKSKQIVDVKNVKPLIQTNGTMFPEEAIDGTVVDENFCKDGFILILPVVYQVAINEKHVVVHEGLPHDNHEDGLRVFTFAKIYVPHANLRRCWKHETGRYGLSEIGILINNVVKMCHRYIEEPNRAINIKLLYMSIATYFRRIAAKMGTKRGEISQYAMAVRYPNAAKAVATLSNSLPKNTIAIHKDMAKKIRVRDGDIVLVERFPCLGFMSLRPQKIKVITDPLGRYTIRVSRNCLGSMSLDFDGDVLFSASFHSDEAKRALEKEWTNPNKSCYDVIKELNKKAGAPHTKAMVLQEYNLEMFADLTNDEHAVLVKRATGVKSHTGPVIALAYNIMRILENSDIRDNQKTNVAVEVFLDKVGNSVFKQKHGVKSLHDVVIDAICTCDIDLLVEHGFNRGTSITICNIIKDKAAQLGVFDLKSYHKWAVANGRSKIINRIVREQNKIYFASRASLEACTLLHCLEQPVVDLPSKMVKWVLSGKATMKDTELDKHLDAKYGSGSIKNESVSKACSTMCGYLQEMLTAGAERESVSRPADASRVVRESYLALKQMWTGKTK